ncbi:MAG TPA: RES domain-containing protein [Terracidiphilus sp.]|nr:RES domain-containing protein [Terracidiphilus sp.]
MTPEDKALDPDFFWTHQPLTLYRLARARYANLSGVGAALAPGRWNRSGEEAIYTSTEIGVPVLERLAHTQKDLIPSNLALMRVRISGQWESHKNALIDPKTSGCLWFYRSLVEARSAFQTGPQMFGVGINPFAVAVPSVIVPVWNVVLYPRGIGFWDHVSLEGLEAFQFDPRLFPENTAIKAEQEEIQG